jgi:biopolymer transport protein TolR
MAISLPGKDERVSAEPNVVPLCDVLLVLLIIFMVVTPLVKKGVDVRLPNATNTIDMPENPEVVLSIKRDGTIFVNQDQATLDTLQLMLEDAFMSASDKKLYLRADGDLEYGYIIDLIETLKFAGVEDIGIITETKTESAD